jgi:hypothetical protein
LSVSGTFGETRRYSSTSIDPPGSEVNSNARRAPVPWYQLAVLPPLGSMQICLTPVSFLEHACVSTGHRTPATRGLDDSTHALLLAPVRLGLDGLPIDPNHSFNRAR